MDWNEVKSKPKKTHKPRQEEDDEGHYGGVSGGHLRAGAIQSKGTGKASVSNAASTIADQDYLRDEDEEIKYELVAHQVSLAVQTARLAKEWSQAQLAKAVNEKTGTIVEIESGTAKYNADTINRIEKVLGVKIPRGRKTQRARKNPAGGF